MTDNIAISVVIPVYNVEKYLRKCLNSVCIQGDCVKEIILINDGSTDGSLAVCEEYAEKDSRIRIINQENKGLSATVRVGIRAAACEYIGFVDSDDYIEPDMYTLMAENMKKYDADVVWCEYDKVNEDGKRLNEELENEGEINVYDKENGRFSIVVYLLPFAPVKSITGSRCNKLVKKDLLINNIAFEDFGINVGEDLALITPVMFTANRIVHINKFLYHYLQRSTSIVHVYNRSSFVDYVKIMNIIKRASEKYNYDIDFEDFAIRILYSNCINKIRISHLGFKERKAELKYIGENAQVRDLLKRKKIGGDFRFKVVMNLLKKKLYGLLALIINKGVKK